MKPLEAAALEADPPSELSVEVRLSGIAAAQYSLVAELLSTTFELTQEQIAERLLRVGTSHELDRLTELSRETYADERDEEVRGVETGDGG